MKLLLKIAVLLAVCTGGVFASDTSEPLCISGIYPHLAYYNNEGECGTGAVVPWAGKLWVITYGPHLPYGSSDKLYEISPDLKQTIRPESIGGTPANRMIHKESNQLFIGPYAINGTGDVRVIPWQQMPGRLTGNARSLETPAKNICFGTMEEGFYEVSVDTLEVKTLYADDNRNKNITVTAPKANLPGCHGKGLYSGQGVLVFSNNGEPGEKASRQFDIEAGVLAEWDGKNWKVVRRNQFVEITGPGGIYGNADPANDPIWTTGWDHRSALVGVRDKGAWSFYRIPKASNTYDGAHGWNTEWPRIRDIAKEGQPRQYLMTMHGMFWDFPETFTAGNTGGIRPKSTYLKVIGDFAEWNGRLVVGCDDSAQKEFLNKRTVKGMVEGPGQSNSNLWFITPETTNELGTNTACGAVWLNDSVKKDIASEPFLFAGWDKRSAWVKNDSDEKVSLIFEIDKKGNNNWSFLKKTDLDAGASLYIPFNTEESGEWIRVTSNRDATLSVEFTYAGTEKRGTTPDPIFNGLSKASDSKSAGGLLYAVGLDRRLLGILSGTFEGEQFTETGYYELNEQMKLTPVADDRIAKHIRKVFSIPKNVVTIDESSLLVVDDLGRRWRLPLGNVEYNDLTSNCALRLCREVSTERDLFNAMGTFYELPAENADGFAKIRPIASHSYRIHDYASYRGMLVMTGIDPGEENSGHIFRSEDGKAAVWAGVIDDLWKLGKPTGHGGPWKNTAAKKGIPSDPYLIGFYDKKTLEISHQSDKAVTFQIEVNPIGHGPWILYQSVTVKPGEKFTHTFPDAFEARWIRFISDKDVTATASLEYK